MPLSTFSMFKNVQAITQQKLHHSSLVNKTA